MSMYTTFQDYANWSNAWTNMNKSTQPFFEAQKFTSAMTEQLIQENLSLWSDTMGGYVEFMQNSNKATRPDDYAKLTMSTALKQISRNYDYMRNLLEIAKNCTEEAGYNVQEKVDSFSNQEYKGPKHHKKEKDTGHHQ